MASAHSLLGSGPRRKVMVPKQRLLIYSYSGAALKFLLLMRKGLVPHMSDLGWGYPWCLLPLMSYLFGLATK